MISFHVNPHNIPVQNVAFQEKPVLQVHENVPGVFLQSELSGQLEGWSHSLMSKGKQILRIK